MGTLPYYIGAYLAGSIPFGWLITKAKGVDIRRIGSGNIGATNVGRALGRKYAILVFLLDFMKGYLPVMLTKSLLVSTGQGASSAWQLIVVALLAVAGHNYPVWLKFKGGKGVATSMGALMALLPGPALITLAVWVLVFSSFRYVSLASLASIVSLPVSTLFLKPELPYLILTATLTILSFIRHRSNIRALLSGTEHQFKKEDASP